MPSARVACVSLGAGDAAWLRNQPCDGEGWGFLEWLSPGGVLPALFVGAGELLGVGVGERCDAEGDGDGDGDEPPDRAGAPGSKLPVEPGAGPRLSPCPAVPA